MDFEYELDAEQHQHPICVVDLSEPQQAVDFDHDAVISDLVELCTLALVYLSGDGTSRRRQPIHKQLLLVTAIINASVRGPGSKFEPGTAGVNSFTILDAIAPVTAKMCRELKDAMEASAMEMVQDALKTGAIVDLTAERNRATNKPSPLTTSSSLVINLKRAVALVSVCTSTAIDRLEQRKQRRSDYLFTCEDCGKDQGLRYTTELLPQGQTCRECNGNLVPLSTDLEDSELDRLNKVRDIVTRAKGYAYPSTRGGWALVRKNQ